MCPFIQRFVCNLSICLSSCPVTVAFCPSVEPMSFASRQRQYHSQIDNLIEETVKEMTTLLVAKVTQADHTPGEGTSGQWRHTHIKIKSQNKDTPSVFGQCQGVADRLLDQRPQPCPRDPGPQRGTKVKDEVKGVGTKRDKQSPCRATDLRFFVKVQLLTIGEKKDKFRKLRRVLVSPVTA